MTSTMSPPVICVGTPDSDEDELEDDRDGGHNFSKSMCKIMYDDLKKSKAVLFAMLVEQIDGDGRILGNTKDAPYKNMKF